jgi:arylsulfatase A-like enzyme
MDFEVTVKIVNAFDEVLQNAPRELACLCPRQRRADADCALLRTLRWPYVGWHNVSACVALAAFALCARLTLGTEPASSQANPRRNVLFIAVDDLRPQLGCYGHKEMITPRLDQLAAEGRLFERHYAQAPTCGASRCAMLTGRYPREPRAYGNDAFATLPREAERGVTSLPRLFREAGYYTASIGKISHSPDGTHADGEDELPFSWDRRATPSGQWGSAWNAFFGYADGGTRIPRMTPAAEHADVPDTGYPDGLIAEAAIDALRELQGKPFFLAVGFFKPHLPFNAPRKYWDLYDDTSNPPTAAVAPPIGINPEISLHHSEELTPRYAGFSTPGLVTAKEAAHLRRGYAACVSYVDAQIGRVLDELDRLGLRESTVVVVWGDHGWHLGEYGIWGKHTLYEAALRAPLIVRSPGMLAPGEPTEGIVESIDIYPTLAELGGLATPAGLDGRSFARQLSDAAAPGKDEAYGFWAAGRAHTVRTRRHRFTQWTARGNPSRVIQTELYDHQTDPDETQNIAAAHPSQVQQFAARLMTMTTALRAEPQADAAGGAPR